jgi:hypothetical protein
MYEAGEIPEELLEGMPISIILDNPKGFLIPPIKTEDLEGVESYMRAQKYVETMA